MSGSCQTRKCAIAAKESRSLTFRAPPNSGSLNSIHIRDTHVPCGGAVHRIIDASVGSVTKAVPAVLTVVGFFFAPFFSALEQRSASSRIEASAPIQDGGVPCAFLLESRRYRRLSLEIEGGDLSTSIFKAELADGSMNRLT